jgi:hypothetical protein
MTCETSRERSAKTIGYPSILLGYQHAAKVAEGGVVADSESAAPAESEKCLVWKKKQIKKANKTGSG